MKEPRGFVLDDTDKRYNICYNVAFANGLVYKLTFGSMMKIFTKSSKKHVKYSTGYGYRVLENTGQLQLKPEICSWN
eukprot:snap_masked-scaffold_18-processed-gene-2.48-mRNA-1 protein AED:1.00 eAED:1.00 QI:0/0/0/0/1/1/2/0/76